ncbi:hypothetical protein LXT21_44075 [Myxococcus sp. K38C18041901]|uniref:hypothetical protein n=1 Tax=Myxococcus guangdongensis TaxID=2906760 RepID=UPI0020A80DFC|nr:hypothetical protein [Myxococcus guangdongensis]MCP3065767.1 hypothetical protein [Myxococcus guangdongensis]
MSPRRCPLCGTHLSSYAADHEHQVRGLLHCPTAARHPQVGLDPAPYVYRPGRNGRLIPVSLVANPIAREKLHNKLGDSG